MKRNISIQIKAAFLLLVFSLNTVIGFACAIGIDMGFNSAHHHDEETAITNTNSHHHDEANNHHHNSKDGKDNCCNDKVMKISQADKSLPPSSSTIITSIFSVVFVSSFYNIDILLTSQSSPTVKYFVRSYHPPIPDIRIAIQSFQI